MPDFVRVGPPYGALNLLRNPRMTGVFTQNGVSYASGALGWQTDSWQPGAGYPTAVASWTMVATAVPGSGASSGVVYQPNMPTANSWNLFMGTGMASGQIVRAASVPRPLEQQVAGAFMFEIFARSSSPLAMSLDIYAAGGASQSGIVSYPTVTASWTRLMAIYPSVPSGPVVDVWVNSIGSAPSGNFIQLSLARVQMLPGLADTGGSWFDGGIMTTVNDQRYALPSALGGTWLGKPGQSVSARHLYAVPDPTFGFGGFRPVMNEFDALQPVNMAVEIGSAIIAEQADLGMSNLIQTGYIEGVALEGGYRAYEDVTLRTWKLPLISRANTPQGVPDLVSRLQRAVDRPGAVMVWINEGVTPSQLSLFDVQGGYFEPQRDLRYARANILKGTLRVDTQPFARSPDWFSNDPNNELYNIARAGTASGVATGFDLGANLGLGDAPPMIAIASWSFVSLGNLTASGFYAFPNSVFSVSEFPIVTANVRTGRMSTIAPSAWASAASYAWDVGNPSAGFAGAPVGSYLASISFGGATGIIDSFAFPTGASMPDRFRLYGQIGQTFASSYPLYLWADYVPDITRPDNYVRGPLVQVPAIPSAGASAYHRLFFYDFGEFSAPSSYQPGVAAAVRVGANVASFAVANGSVALYTDVFHAVPADGLLVFAQPSAPNNVNGAISIAGDRPLITDAAGRDVTAVARGALPFRAPMGMRGGWVMALHFGYWAQQASALGAATAGPTQPFALPNAMWLGAVNVVPRFYFTR